MDDFFACSQKIGFWVFLLHPTVVSVLLPASVKRCFVFRMRDFFKEYSERKTLRLFVVQYLFGSKSGEEFVLPYKKCDIILKSNI